MNGFGIQCKKKDRVQDTARDILKMTGLMREREELIRIPRFRRNRHRTKSLHRGQGNRTCVRATPANLNGSWKQVRDRGSGVLSDYPLNDNPSSSMIIHSRLCRIPDARMVTAYLLRVVGEPFSFTFP